MSYIGIDLGGTKTDVAFLEEEGKVKSHRQFATPVHLGPDGVLKEIIRAVCSLQKEEGQQPVAIGVGLAGQITSAGHVLFAPNLKWVEYPFKLQLEKALSLPVLVTNDVRAAAWGEWNFGAGRGSRNLVCLFIGTGVGGAIIANGALLEGAIGSAGEVGHLVVQSGGAPCTCGSRGCLEAYAGGWAIARRARELIGEDPERGRLILTLAEGQEAKVTAKQVTAAYLAKDKLAEQIVLEAVSALGSGIASLVNVLNPERIVMGGGVVTAIPSLLSLVEKEVRKQALAAALQTLSFFPAELRSLSGVIGAASMAKRRYVTGISSSSY